MINYFIIKVAGVCNLSCDYCYYMNHRHFQRPATMDRRFINLFYRKLADYIRANGIRKVTLTWHGGEPLLVGKSLFSEVLLLQSAYFSTDVKIVNLIQTNGTLVDKDWIELFEKFDFSVGVSIDGPRKLHDRLRRYPDLSGSYDAVTGCINDLLQSDVRVGSLTVINPSADGAEVFDHHVALGLRKMGFNLPIISKWDATRTEGFSTAGCADYVLRVFNRWLDLDDPKIDVRSLRSMIAVMVGARSGLCQTSNSCGRFVTIEPDGAVGLCENLRVITERDVYGTGLNLNRASLFDVERRVGELFETLAINQSAQECADCYYEPVCNGGCPVHRWTPDRQFGQPSLFCEYYKRLAMRARRLLDDERLFEPDRTHVSTWDTGARRMEV